MIKRIADRREFSLFLLASATATEKHERCWEVPLPGCGRKKGCGTDPRRETRSPFASSDFGRYVEPREGSLFRNHGIDSAMML